MKKNNRKYQTVKMQTLCHLITDGKHGDCENEEGSGFYFISSKDVNDGKINYENARQITFADFQNTHRRTQLEPFDILITNSGTIGRMAVVREGELTPKTTFQKSVAILKPDKKRVSTFWLFYYLRCHEERLISYAGGTAQKNLLLRDLRAFEVELPSLALQARVASMLSAYDDLIENNARRIKILEEMAKLIYREWFVEFKAPGVKLRKASHEEKKVTGKDVFPVEWEAKTLGDFLELAYGKGLKSEDRSNFGNPVYGSSGIIGYHNKPLVKGPGIIVGRKGNVGSLFWSEEDFYPIDTAFFVRTNISLHYAFYNLSGQTFLNSNAAVPGLNRESALMKTAILPDKNSMDNFDKIIAPMFEQIRLLKTRNRNLRCTRDLLLPKLVSGQIEV